MPVMRDHSKPNMSIIDLKYGLSPPDMTNISSFLKVNDIVQFLNDNYIDYYELSTDYISRKLTCDNSRSLVYTDVATGNIIGYVYSSTFIFQGKPFTYVDLLCVHKLYRKTHIAERLIDAIIYVSPIKQIIHKKDSTCLPFKHFHQTSHYSCGVAYLCSKYTEYSNKNQWIIDEKESSETVKIYRSSIGEVESVVKFVVFGFKNLVKNGRLGEIYFCKDLNSESLYIELIYIFKSLDIDFLVTLPLDIFEKKINSDFYAKGMDLYMYGFNIYLDYIEKPFWLDVF
jgi:hypothetical protein